MSIGRNILKTAVWLLAGCALAAQVGCSGKKTYGAIEVITDPPGAEVVNLKDDAHLGRTPVKVVWEGKQGKPEYVTIQMRKNGYREEITSLWVNTRHADREQAMAEPQPVNVELQEKR